MTGSSLAATMMVVAAIVSFLSIAALVTSQFGRYAGQQRGASDTIAACDSALEYAYAQWKRAAGANGNGVPAPSACGISADSFNSVYGNTSGFAKPGIRCTSLVLVDTDQTGQSGQPPVTLLPPAKVPTLSVPGYPGWSGSNYNYRAEATVTNTTYGSTSTVTAQRFFQLTKVPLFQAAIFYENKLEIHPGDAMKVTGLVHTNGDLWAQGFSTLQFMSNVSYVGAFHQAADPTVRYGWDGYGYGLFPGSSQEVTWANGSTYSNPSGNTSQLNQVTAIDPFGNTLATNNNLHKIIDPPAPADVANTQIAYNNASLIITVNTALANNAAGRYTITDGNGNALPTTGADYQNVMAAIGGSTVPTATTTSTITDMREASTVTITNLDMAKLAAAVMPVLPPATAPYNGVYVDGSPPLASTPVLTQDTWQAQFAAKPTVYIQDVGPTTSSTRRAIRLINGRNLYQSVSVASNNGMYVQGDYNTGGTSASSVPSNTSSTGANVATGYTSLSSAVMADAVTILSNNWNDAYSSNTLAGTLLNSNNGNQTTGRVATPTTVNTAIMAGDVPSNLNGDGIASGGAHNFPRLLEDWTNKDFTYYGSLVEAFTSTKYKGNWQTGNVYTWPVRLWNFDTNFVNNPPPGSATGQLFNRGRYLRVQ